MSDDWMAQAREFVAKHEGEWGAAQAKLILVQAAGDRAAREAAAERVSGLSRALVEIAARVAGALGPVTVDQSHDCALLRDGTVVDDLIWDEMPGMDGGPAPFSWSVGGWERDGVPVGKEPDMSRAIVLSWDSEAVR